jgi:hypothetical protein
MKSPNIDAARRLDRLLKLQLFRSVALLAGWLMIILSGVAVGMTVRFTPDQRFGLLAVNPKGFLWNPPWLPAPPHFRILGAVMLMLGIALVTFATIWSRKPKSRTVA